MSWSGPSFTPVEFPPFPERIHYEDTITMVGSCFAEHIADRLAGFKYTMLQNPFGILYNPISIEKSIQRIVHRQFYSSEELTWHDGLFHSMDHHGSFSGSDKEEVGKRINESIDLAHAHLLKSKFIFISPGTTWVYRYKNSERIAGNCHKIPQVQFDKFKLSFEETCQSYTSIHTLIKDVAPGAKIIWTVSPVRHIRDGMIANQQSKASLILASEHMTNHQSDCYYFPAYEIMVDQLRDYRYYADDMIHPSKTAINIIWELFRELYLDDKDRSVHSMIEKVQLGMQHRFLHDRKEAINEFAKAHLDQIKKIESLKPNLDFSEERRYFTSLATPLTP